MSGKLIEVGSLVLITRGKRKGQIAELLVWWATPESVGRSAASGRPALLSSGGDKFVLTSHSFRLADRE